MTKNAAWRTLAILLAGCVTAPAYSQLTSTGPVTNGHHHLNISDLAAHQRFWVDTLGGQPGMFANRTPIVMFPNALVFLREQPPTAGSIDSTVNHIAFSVPNLRATVDRLVDAGYEMVTAEQSPPGSEVVDGIRIVPGSGLVSGVSYVLGPDDVKVEVLEMRAQQLPIASHHIHFFGHQNEAMRAWYVETFGAAAQPGAANGFVVATLPGLSLNFSPTEQPMAGTAGRAIDHIGFEIDGLQAFVEKLEADGITFDVPYRELPEAGISLAFFTDPWGTYIELTEGLDDIR